MNEYQVLTPEIQVPKEWPMDGIEDIVKYMVQDAVNCHRLGKKFVMTVGNVSAMIKDNGARPGYVFEKIKEIKDDDAYRFDLIIPSRITILKRTNGRPNDRKEDSVEFVPMNLKFDHPIAKLVSTCPDRHTVMTIVPDVEKILLQKGVLGSDKHNYSLRTTYRVHNIKWLDDIMSDMETDVSTTESSIVDAQQISKNIWNIVCYSDPSQPQRFWYIFEVAFPWILYLTLLPLLAFIIYVWIFII